MKKSRKGFTLIELLVLFAIIAILCFLLLVIPLLCGNFWFTYEGVLTKIQFAENPEAEKIVDVNRNVYSYSEITVRNKDGSNSKYNLDTCILYSYRLIPIGDD